MDEQTRCWIKPTSRGNFHWRVQWPNGGSISGNSPSWSGAADEVREQLHTSVYRQRMVSALDEEQKRP